jgi:phage tail sheath protein FI
MPEYLAPGVYVEEMQTGSKPIEGVSTSTAGMIGVTERGPVNTPILVTSYEDFRRWFGDNLNPVDFSDASGGHCYLPHAVEGFFNNGGKRLYVTRVLDINGAKHALRRLFDRGDPTSTDTMLLRAVDEHTGTATDQPLLYVLDVTGIQLNDWIRIGGGSSADYRQVAAVGSQTSSTHVSLNFPLRFSHAISTPVIQFTRSLTPEYNGPFSLFQTDAEAGDTTLAVEGKEADISTLVDSVNEGTPPSPVLLEIGGEINGEFHFVAAVTTNPGSPTQALVHLRSPLAMAHSSENDATLITPIAVPSNSNDHATLAFAPNTESRVLFLQDRNGNFDDRKQLLEMFDADLARREVRRIGDLSQLEIVPGAYGGYAPGSLVEAIVFQDDSVARWTVADTGVGSRVIALNNRWGLSVGDVISVGVTSDKEFVTIAALPNTTGVAPDSGNVVLEQALAHGHDEDTEVRRQSSPAVGDVQPTVLALGADSNDQVLVVTDGDGYNQDKIIRLTTPRGECFYHRLTGPALSSLGTLPGFVPADVTLTEAVTRSHPIGSAIVSRQALLEVQALDAGGWGDRLRISVEDEEVGLVPHTTIESAVNDTTVRLTSLAGVEPGTILEFVSAIDASVIDAPVKVVGIDRRERTASLANPMSSAQSDGLAQGVLNARSREFRLTVSLLSQPNAALPTRDNSVIATEVFRHLSMDPRHSRYVGKVIGEIDGEPRLSDRRAEGESWYVRVRDVAATEAEWGPVRLGPEALVDVLPDGREQPARQALAGGFDSVATLSDSTYIGTDDYEPANRTGLFTLKNEEDISLIACPGRTSTRMQQALIDHCESMHYRFAVLDGSPPPRDSLSDVQAQRQAYDTKYAALYHPWLLIPDPYPINLAQVADFAIPPSGHMLGIYARTDIERGVHKAPANEVVRGIKGLQRTLRQSEQDILNPFPVNINVIRDFRSNNRGIRVWGGRVITSDPDWKYINVRRLLIFIESSVERGLQWVVFEPNSESLWARVRRTVTNFLTIVWRNGALEGSRVEEAFFVKCDRTTMTQTDIDNGRLICVVGVAPVKPAEFVIIRIGLWTAHAEQ